MICKQITFRKFRNIDFQSLEFENGINVLSGDNAEGKTNALEGLYLFANGKSFRKCGDKEMINKESDFSHLKMEYSDSVRCQSMEIKMARGNRKICSRNGVGVKKIADFLGYFRAVLFCPEHLSIIKDGPSERRLFLDSAISQLKPIYLSSLSKYNEILEQRNSLIKNYEENKCEFDSTIDLWSGYLAREAALISRERYEYCEILSKFSDEFFKDMTGGRESVSLEYSSVHTEEEYYKMLSDNREKEIAAGTTLYGIHKDDIDIFLNNSPARFYCSQGQQRSLALSMKMGEGEISKQMTGEYPVFLLDDIFSELDKTRKEYIVSGIKNRQVIMTGCEKTDIEEKAEALFEVKSGVYTRIK